MSRGWMKIAVWKYKWINGIETSMGEQWKFDENQLTMAATDVQRNDRKRAKQANRKRWKKKTYENDDFNLFIVETTTKAFNAKPKLAFVQIFQWIKSMEKKKHAAESSRHSHIEFILFCWIFFFLFFFLCLSPVVVVTIFCIIAQSKLPMNGAKKLCIEFSGRTTISSDNRLEAYFSTRISTSTYYNYSFKICARIYRFQKQSTLVCEPEGEAECFPNTKYRKKRKTRRKISFY